jgi:hypothetical protein
MRWCKGLHPGPAQTGEDRLRGGPPLRFGPRVLEFCRASGGTEGAGERYTGSAWRRAAFVVDCNPAAEAPGRPVVACPDPRDQAADRREQWIERPRKRWSRN